MANKLLPEISLTAAIEAFATKELRKLTSLVPSKRQKIEKASQPASAKPIATGVKASDQERVEVSNDAPTTSASKRQREENVNHKDDLGSGGAGVDSKRQRTGEPASSDGMADNKQANGHAATGGPRSPELHLHACNGMKQQALPFISWLHYCKSLSSISCILTLLRVNLRFRSGAATDRSVEAVNDSGRPLDADSTSLDSSQTPETAARHCELYCALCTKHHVLLRDLFVVFGECKGLGRAAIMRNADGLARVLGASAPAFLALIDDTPGGSTNLLIRMLNFLTETQIPPKVFRLGYSQHTVKSRGEESSTICVAKLTCYCSFGLITQLDETHA